MTRSRLDDEVLRAIRKLPDSTLAQVAEAAGLPRSNFGRQLTGRLEMPLRHLIADGLVEERGSRYRLTERGRRAIAADALGRG